MLPNNIIIRPEVMEKADSFRQEEHSASESGFFLLGQWRDGDFIIEDITGPHEGDFRTRHSVSPDREMHGGEANAKCILFDKCYIGEGHTHPELFPVPSDQDIETFREISIIAGVPIAFIIFGKYEELDADRLYIAENGSVYEYDAMRGDYFADIPE